MKISRTLWPWFTAALLVIIAVLWWQRSHDNAETASGAQSFESVFAPSRQENGPIKVPTPTSRAAASDLASTLFKNFAHEEVRLYSLELLKKNSVFEDYQVLYRSRPVENFTYRRMLSATDPVEPFVALRALDERDLLSERDVERLLRAAQPDIDELKFEDMVWGLGDNQTLYPAYKYAVKLKNGVRKNQTWVIHAKSGEVMSRNTFSRN
ncbi:MAG TPA: hypothetical protein VM901_03955 [Bdellovibrionota bacterium]|jgi:hypothetical protein|nr:hypothetical protein [Bdellovibrionota bacterium]